MSRFNVKVYSIVVPAGTEKRLFVYNPAGLTQTSNIRIIFAFGGAFH